MLSGFAIKEARCGFSTCPQWIFPDLPIKKGLRLYRGDLTNAEEVEAAIQGVDAVIHLAALMPPGSEKNRPVTFAVNVEGTTRLAEDAETG